VSIRVGESWTARNGHRRWISMSLGTYLLGFGCWSVLALPFACLWWVVLAELWVCAEALLLAVTGGLVLLDLARRVIRFSDVTVTGQRWGLFGFDVRGARP
jgi:hypothetical protein